MAFSPSQSVFHVIGCMSGSSLDGLDLAYVRFERKEVGWHFECLETDTLNYNSAFAAKFIQVMNGSALELAHLNKELGRFIGQACGQLAVGQPVDLIASHGHTIFHQPNEGLTLQIGSGAEIAAETGTLTCCDFRTLDVALGGQGAPLVPLGEANLFKDYKVFLNLGGIANIGLHGEQITGFDTGICNQALNYLAAQANLTYDRDGKIARSGQINESLFDSLNKLPFHVQQPPKSLGREFFNQAVRPLLDQATGSVADKLCTTVEHIAVQVSAALEGVPNTPILTTGGGALNGFLVERLQKHCKNTIEVPPRQTVEFKEAIIFAFLGLLRVLERPNTLSEVTNAPLDNIGGCLYLPPSTLNR